MPQWVTEVWPAQVLLRSRIYVAIQLTFIISTNLVLIMIAINFACQMSRILAKFSTGIALVL